MQFFIVGGQRCGTTWLYNVLDSHPDICMAKPVRPEPKFFLKDDFRYCIKSYRDNYYSDKAIAYGEKSTSYYELPYIPERILSSFSDSKIIFCLRNPIDRAISNFYFSKSNGLEERDINIALSTTGNILDVVTETSVSPFNYLGRGHYSTYIKRYIEVFGSENVFICSFEQLLANSSELKRLLGFVGVNSDLNLTSIPLGKINSSARDTCDLSDIRVSLKNYYKSDVEKLKSYLDVSFWQDFREVE